MFATFSLVTHGEIYDGFLLKLILVLLQTQTSQVLFSGEMMVQPFKG